MRAATERLELVQEAVDETQNECAVIPDILDRSDLKGAVARHFAINAVRLGKGKHSIKTTRKLAGRDANLRAGLLTPNRR